MNTRRSGMGEGMSPIYPVDQEGSIRLNIRNEDAPLIIIIYDADRGSQVMERMIEFNEIRQLYGKLASFSIKAQNRENDASAPILDLGLNYIENESQRLAAEEIDC